MCTAAVCIVGVCGCHNRTLHNYKNLRLRNIKHVLWDLGVSSSTTVPSDDILERFLCPTFGGFFRCFPTIFQVGRRSAAVTKLHRLPSHGGSRLGQCSAERTVTNIASDPKTRLISRLLPPPPLVHLKPPSLSSSGGCWASPITSHCPAQSPSR